MEPGLVPVSETGVSGSGEEGSLDGSYPAHQFQAAARNRQKYEEAMSNGSS